MAWLDTRTTPASARLAESLRDGTAHVSRVDRVVAGLIEQHGACKLPTTRSPFQVMLETIVSQQLSTHAARAIYGRLVQAAGGRPRPENILTLSERELIACGLSRAKAVYVRNVAGAFVASCLDRRAFARADDETVMRTLTAIRGVGDWSAHMFLIFALHRLDVFPIGDLGLRKSMAARYGLRSSTPVRRFERIAEAWRPYRTVGTLYLWRSYDNL